MVRFVPLHVADLCSCPHSRQGAHGEEGRLASGGCSGCPETSHHFPWHLVNSMTLLLSCCPSEAVTAGAVPACHQIHHSQRHSHFIFEALSSLSPPDCTDYTWIQTDGGLRPNSALPPLFILKPGKEGRSRVSGSVLCPSLQPRRLLRVSPRVRHQGLRS